MVTYSPLEFPIMGISVKVFFIKEKKSYVLFTWVPRNKPQRGASWINRCLQAHLESESLLSDEDEEEDDEEESELELLALRRDAAS